jgi:hypothetical protein
MCELTRQGVTGERHGNGMGAEWHAWIILYCPATDVRNANGQQHAMWHQQSSRCWWKMWLTLTTSTNYDTLTQINHDGNQFVIFVCRFWLYNKTRHRQKFNSEAICLFLSNRRRENISKSSFQNSICGSSVRRHGAYPKLFTAWDRQMCSDEMTTLNNPGLWRRRTTRYILHSVEFVWCPVKVYEDESRNFRTEAIAKYRTPNKRVWKLPTSTQLHAAWHTNTLEMVVLPSIGASRYHNCCIDWDTGPEYLGFPLVDRSKVYTRLGAFLPKDVSRVFFQNVVFCKNN